MPKKIKQEEIEKMVEMYEQGYFMAEIARLLNLSRNTVSKYLKEEGKEPIVLESEMEGVEKEEVIGSDSKEPIGLLPFDLQKRIWLTADEYGVPLEDVADQVIGLIRYTTYEQLSLDDLTNVIDFLQEHRKEIRSKGLDLKVFCSEIKSIRRLKEEIEGLREELKKLENTKNLTILMSKNAGKSEVLQDLFSQLMQMKLAKDLQEEKQVKERKEEGGLFGDTSFLQDLLLAQLLPGQAQPTHNQQTSGNVDLTTLQDFLQQAEQQTQPEPARQPWQKQTTIGERLRQSLKEKKQEEKA